MPQLVAKFILTLLSVGIYSGSSYSANPEVLSGFCKKLDRKFEKLKWDAKCPELSKLTFARVSHEGYPLISSAIGADNLPTLLLMCTVHGDEVSTAYFCFRWISEKIEIPGFRVVVAPIINPDGFFRSTRHNLRGVDLNRNFPTTDFAALAEKNWIKGGKDKRKFPGRSAGSERETVFQMKLLDVYKPIKIVSVHAPLKMLDYDGPTLALVEEARIQRSAQDSGIKLQAFNTYPGSLGRYAGEEKKIPTFTLELPSAEPKSAKESFQKFVSVVKDAFTDQKH